MKRVISGFIAALFILTFVTCVNAYGTNKRFSFEVYLNRLTKLQGVGFLNDAVKCWTEDGYNATDAVAGPGGGENSGGSGNIVYYEEYDGDNEILTFFDSLRGFFLRSTRMLKLIGKSIVALFDDLDLLIPWNATVKIEGETA